MSKSQDNYLSAYKSQNKWKSNREARLLRELKRNPNNAKQIEEAIANLKYRRKTPNTQMWSKSQIRTAKLFKEFTGKAPIACFSSNAQIANAALASLFRTHHAKLPEGKVSFALGDRAFK